MSNYGDRYKRIIEPILAEHNKRCDQLAGKDATKLTMADYQFIADMNPEYYAQLKKDRAAGHITVIDSNELKTFTYDMAMIHEKNRADKKRQDDAK